MKVEIKESNQKKERDFPKLMITKAGSIVLMYSHRVGTLLVDEEDMRTCVGESTSTWIMDHFSDFEGSITLSNE